jgi:hypothetical protein
LRSGPPAIDPENFAGHEARLFRCDEHNGIGDFVRRSGPLERHAREEGRLTLCRTRQPVEHRGLDRTGSDGIDAYAERGSLERC